MITNTVPERTLATMEYTPTEAYETAKYTLRAILVTMPTETALIFDEEPPSTEENGLTSWATRLRRTINDTEVSWHIVSDEDGLVDISRSVSFLTPDGTPINHTTLLRTVDLGETSRQMFSSFICQIIIGLPSVPMLSHREAKEWARVATEDAGYVFHLGVHHLLTKGSSHLWETLDVSDRFAVVHLAAEERFGHALGRHKELWSKVGVQFDSSDVYNDAWYEEASRLMETITPREKL